MTYRVESRAPEEQVGNPVSQDGQVSAGGGVQASAVRRRMKRMGSLGAPVNRELTGRQASLEKMGSTGFR